MASDPDRRKDTESDFGRCEAHPDRRSLPGGTYCADCAPADKCSYCGAPIEQTPEGPLYRCRSTCPEPSFHERGHESPLHATADAVTRMSSRESWPKWVREIVEPLEAERDELKVGVDELTRILYSSDPAPWQEHAMKMMREAEAERDALKADVAEMQRKLDKAKQQRNEFRAALYDTRTAHRAEVAALRASEVSREALDEAQKEITKLKHKNHALQHNKHGT